MADIVVDGRDKIRRIYAEDGDLVGVSPPRNVRTFEQANLPIGCFFYSPDSHQFIENGAGRGIPAVFFDELPEADGSPLERQIHRAARFVVEQGIANPTRDDPRRPVVSLPGPHIARLWGELSAATLF